MMKDKERPGLRAKLQQAIKGAFASPFAPVRHSPHLFLLGSSSSANAEITRPRRRTLTRPHSHPRAFSNAAANEACKDGATVECAAAWEEVDGLEDAAMRAGG